VILSKFTQLIVPISQFEWCDVWRVWCDEWCVVDVWRVAVVCGVMWCDVVGHVPHIKSASLRWIKCDIIKIRPTYPANLSGVMCGVE
jgi:hypothetical protein